MTHKHLLAAAFALALAACGGQATFEEELELAASSLDSAPAGCTHTGGWWKNNNRYAPLPANQIPWPIDEDMLVCGTRLHTWVTTAAVKGDVLHNLIKYTAAALLNERSGAVAPQDIRDKMLQAKMLIQQCSLATSDHMLAFSLIRDLEQFNNGLVGPGPCP